MRKKLNRPKGWPSSKQMGKALEWWTQMWHRKKSPIRTSGRGGLGLVKNIHRFNFKLWHEEDQARRRDVGDRVIAQVKRNIDSLNQQRNDAIEQFDDWVVQQLGLSAVAKTAKQNSETLGSIADRMSILALRMYHMAVEARRRSASVAHRRACAAKLQVLRIQRSDLARCFDELVMDCVCGNRYFKTYRQFKMYNNARLNPALYGK